MQTRHPPSVSRFRRTVNSAALLILSLLAFSCATTGPGEPPPLSPGFAVFDMPGVYDRGMARVETVPRGSRVQLLETFEGSFELHRRRGGGVVIRNDQMGYPGLNRSFSGSGTLTGDSGAEGEAEIWIRMAGPVRRDHRKGPWTLRPATPQEIEQHENRVRRLEERKRRAGML